jgi:hypothetical protein
VPLELIATTNRAMLFKTHVFIQVVFSSMYLCINIATNRQLRDTLRGRDRACLEMHLEGVIERLWRCTWRPKSSVLRDALAGRNRASLVMHLEAEIE